MSREEQQWTQVGINCLLHKSVKVEKIRTVKSSPGPR